MKSHDADLSVTDIAEVSKLSLNHLFAQRAMRAFAAHFNEGLRPAGITALQFCMLALLHRREPLVFGDMAAELAMDRSHLSTHLAPLFRRRLVSIVPHDTDRRKRQIVLTVEGRTVLAGGSSSPLVRSRSGTARLNASGDHEIAKPRSPRRPRI